MCTSLPPEASAAPRALELEGQLSFSSLWSRGHQLVLELLESLGDENGEAYARCQEVLDQLS